MYKLVSTYSLVKPPPGSNVSGEEVLGVLLKLEDMDDNEERKSQWEAQIDTILDKGTDVWVLAETETILKEHNYTRSDYFDYIMSYMAGYVARKGPRFASFKENGKMKVCNTCIQTFQLCEGSDIPQRDRFIELKSKGHLLHPSAKLFDLVTILERAILETLRKSDINSMTLFEITASVSEVESLPLVGCVQHSAVVTRKILCFYLTTRMYFICEQFNKNHQTEKRHTQEKRKAAKLINAANINDDHAC